MADRTHTKMIEENLHSLSIPRSSASLHPQSHQSLFRVRVQRVSHLNKHRSLDINSRRNKTKRRHLNKVSPNPNSSLTRSTKTNGHEIDHELFSAFKNQSYISTQTTNSRDLSNRDWMHLGKDKDTIATNLQFNRKDFLDKQNRISRNRKRKQAYFAGCCCCHCSPLCMLISIFGALLIGIAISTILIAVLIRSSAAKTSTMTTSTSTTATTTTSTTSTSTTTTSTSTTTTTTTATTSTSTTTTTTTATTSTSTTTTTITATTATTTTITTTTVTTAAILNVGVSVSSTNSAWYASHRIVLSCTASLTNLTVIITVQKTVGAIYRNMWSMISNSIVIQSYIDNGAQVTYIWTIISGQTISSINCPYTLEAEIDLQGTAQPMSGDTYEVSIETTIGNTNTFSGHF